MRVRAVWAFVVTLIATGAAQGAINLSFVPVTQNVNPGGNVSVQVIARPDAAAQNFISFQVIFSWDPSLLRLTGASLVGAPSYSGAGFFHDPYGINESPLPTDGSGIFVGLGPLGGAIAVPSSGIVLTTLTFQALAPTSNLGTPVSILASAGSPLGTTVVYGDGGPNQDVTGARTGASVVIIPGPATGLAGVLWIVIARRRRSENASAPRA